MPRLYVLDGHGYIFRAHFGLMNAGRGERAGVRLTNGEGMPTGAIFVFARMLMRLHQDVHPDHIAVVFDAGRKSFRTELYPEYKAHRPDTPEDLVVQMPYFSRLVEALRWPLLRVPGVEADDVIATLATQARAAGWEVVIYSGDKDLMQLVGDGVTMVDSLHQRTFGPDDVVAKFGVPPHLVADYLALVGDTSDNVPGLEGVGPKTAAKLLLDHGSLEAAIEADPPVPRAKVKRPLSDPEQLARVRLSRQLVELRRDVALDRPLDELRAQPWDVPALLALFRELEFQQLIDKVDAETSPPAAAPEVDATAASAGEAPPLPFGSTTAAEIVVRPDALAELAADARAADAIAVWVEVDAARTDAAHLVALVIAVPGRVPAYVPLGHRYIGAPVPPLPADLAPLLAVLADPAVPKRCHDGKLAARVLADAGWPLAGVVDDTMLASFLLDSTRDAAAIDDVAALVGLEVPPVATVAGRGKRSLESAPVETAAPWAGQAAAAVLTAAPRLAARLDEAGLGALYRDVELPVARLLVDLERRGVTLDVERVRALAEEVGAQLAALERQVFELAGEEFNLGSPKQLGHVLFERLGLVGERMRKTKHGFSTDHEVLESLLDAHPIIAPILEHRELGKLKGTYLDALPPLVNPRTGRLHTTFNMVAAATGRISSQDPNLQNIPVRTELGRRIRGCFVAAPGRVLVAADYSQIELRILAHLSGDPTLVQAFRDRVDVHTQTAAEVFAIPREQVGPAERRVAKAVNYGLVYGQSTFGLARALDIPRDEAKTYIERYFARFARVRGFMDEVVAEARRRGGSRTLLGRWRPIPELGSRSVMARRGAERVAQNTPMQGAGADLIKLAMLRTHARLAREGLDAPMLLTVHDELVFEAEPAVAERVGALVAEEMTQAYPLAVPLEVDVGIATNWADA
ncbi:MAG: DNA polymerase I [Kofleriaceae bacterium]